MGDDEILAPRFAAPYTAVVFTSLRTDGDRGYAAVARRMADLAAEQPGYLGIDSARDPDTGLGITVSYWRDADAARAWKAVPEHERAQAAGRRSWYDDYVVRVVTVERDYSLSSRPGGERPAPAPDAEPLDVPHAEPLAPPDDDAESLDLSGVRAGIDAIDGELVRLLARRQRLVERAGALKRGRAEDAVRDRDRVAQVVSSRRRTAVEAGLDPAVAEAVWRTMIDAFIALELRVHAAE